jgi:uncharacterized protein (DUF924 family)
MTSDSLPRQVLEFWFGAGADYGRRHKRWFEKDPAFDARVRSRFGALLQEMVTEKHGDWLGEPSACLARVLVLDQFPRHIYRGSAQAFSADPLALQAAGHAVAEGYDAGMLPVERLFLYLPFEHSETLEDQQRACQLTAALEPFPETDDAYRYAVAHRDIIARFGRFPHRNAALGRTSTPEEAAFLEQPGSAF